MTNNSSPRQQRFRPQTAPGWWTLGLLCLVALTLPLGNLLVLVTVATIMTTVLGLFFGVAELLLRN